MPNRVLRGSVVMCLTRNPGVLGSSCTGSSGFFSWECPWARHFRAQPSTGETQESMNNVSCRSDMTEILLTHSYTMTPFDAPGKQAF